MTTYRQIINQANPGCVVFLIDQSRGMSEGIAGGRRPKTEVVATALNRFIGELVWMCEKGEDKPRHWFDVGLIGYTTDNTGAPVVGSAWGGALAGRGLVGIPDLYDHPLDVEARVRRERRDDGAGGRTEVVVETSVPVWYRPPARERTFGSPMCAAFAHAHRAVAAWVAAHPDSFPPLVVNLTGGEWTDGDPEESGRAADRLKALATSDGDLLLFNWHLSGRRDEPVVLPTDERQLADDAGRALFRLSSPLPDSVRGAAERKGISAPPGCRAMAADADPLDLLKVLRAGGALPGHLR